MAAADCASADCASPNAASADAASAAHPASAAAAVAVAAVAFANSWQPCNRKMRTNAVAAHARAGKHRRTVLFSNVLVCLELKFEVRFRDALGI